MKKHTADMFRLLQCLMCLNDPEICGCTEQDEDEHGMCKKARMREKEGEVKQK